MEAGLNLSSSHVKNAYHLQGFTTSTLQHLHEKPKMHFLNILCEPKPAYTRKIARGYHGKHKVTATIHRCYYDSGAAVLTTLLYISDSIDLYWGIFYTAL